MLCVRLDTGQFYQADGTITKTWASDQSVPLKIAKVLLWGGISIGAIMDFSATLYATGQGAFIVTPGVQVVNWMPLAVASVDRYGTSNGQPYLWWVDWAAQGLMLAPGQQLILQANCVNHNPGTNPVIGTPGPADNCHAQAYVWLT